MIMIAKILPDLAFLHYDSGCHLYLFWNNPLLKRVNCQSAIITKQRKSIFSQGLVEQNEIERATDKFSVYCAILSVLTYDKI